jgi:hypothetical protein
MIHRSIIIVIIFLAIFIQACGQTREKKFTDEFLIDSCRFSSTGRNPFFILEPGYQLILEGKEGNKMVRLMITVLNETKKIGNIETRVVEENESENGKIVEISRNYFAISEQTGSVFYFGEDVDMYENGKIVDHEGAWLTGGKNKAGIIMPGNVLLGSRYYQEMAPAVAMDRAEIISLNERTHTPSGNYENCLKTEETNGLNPKEKEFKFYARGIGLVREEDLFLIKFGFVDLRNR